MFIGEQATVYGRLCTEQAGFIYPGDKKHRVEIVGHNMELTEHFTEIVASLKNRPLVQVVQTTWGEILNFPELEEAYPNLMKLPVLMRQHDAEHPSSMGQVNQNLVTSIFTDHLQAKDPMHQPLMDVVAQDVLYHELQHVVQAIEGFAAGSSPTAEFLQIARKCYEAIQRGDRSVTRTCATDTPIYLTDSSALSAYESVLAKAVLHPSKYCTSKIKELALPEAQEHLIVVLNLFASQDYEQRAGEIEARTSASRSLFTAKMRARHKPYAPALPATKGFKTANDNGVVIAYEPRRHNPHEEAALRKHKLLRLPKKRLGLAQLYLGCSL